MSRLTSVQRARLDRAPTVGTGLPGPDAPPWYCAGGALAGMYLKADVEEVQKPDMTRKLSSNLTRTGVGSRDARPLAPPPIVRVRLWECKENGDRIREVDMKAGAAIHSGHPGLLCNAVLFPYNHKYDTDPSIPPHDHPGPSPILPATAPPHPHLARESTPVPPTLPRRPNRELPESLAMRKDEVLDGSRDKQCEIKQAFREDEGVQAAYFVFDDLKVKERGHFVLRYTVMWFDPTAQYMGPWRTLGYTFGGVFAVFPSKKCVWTLPSPLADASQMPARPAQYRPLPAFIQTRRRQASEE
ncbi:hypothetical protein EXIGLDRAFT_305169 [Exidia glandulosa HHB12029]|uniref:Velvet domain-containing protein n=1 Tax=Exidia glandulosa HHB12029 TaxID=1314781 RepID=A0A165D4J4_EXIGL|nr:hypothetical protein EXIGLDRAFT_305169 [Exidia glandulosa HHB12029]